MLSVSTELHGKFTVGGYYYQCGFRPSKLDPLFPRDNPHIWKPPLWIQTVIFRGLLPKPRKTVYRRRPTRYYCFEEVPSDPKERKGHGFKIESLEQAERSVLTIDELAEQIADFKRDRITRKESTRIAMECQNMAEGGREAQLQREIEQLRSAGTDELTLEHVEWVARNSLKLPQIELKLSRRKSTE
jgi:hypothetical protein